MAQKTAFEFGDEFIRNPNFENVTNYLGALNKALYGINPFEKSKKLDIDYQDVSVDIEIQKEIEKDMFEHDCHKGPEDACQICDNEENLY